MKLRFATLAMLLVLSIARVHAGNITVSVVTNPPQGGTVTGAGIYPQGSAINLGVQASTGWYVTNATANGVHSLYFVSARQEAYIEGDLTLLTNYQEVVNSTSDQAYIVTFALAWPLFNQPSSNIVAVTGSSVTFDGGAGGRQPISYSWQGGNIAPGTATESTLTLTNLLASDSGTYTVTATNVFRSTNESFGLRVEDLVVSTNGTPVTNAVASLGTAFVSFQSRFSNGPIYYTLDGSTPDFTGRLYSGEFGVSTSCVIRAVGYRSDFLQTVFSDTIPLTVIPTYVVAVTYSAGGTVIQTPGGLLTNGTVVTLVSAPNPGWTYIGWVGGTLSTNLTNTFIVNGNAFFTPIFATTISNTVLGSGSVTLSPNATLYPAGTSVEVTAVPAPGNYLAAWANAFIGSANSTLFYVTYAQPVISALFAPIPAGKASLTVISDGGGFTSVDVLSSLYPIGTNVSITAYPDFGSVFLGWGGDGSGTNNPLSLTVTKSMVVNAHFSKTSRLSLTRSGGTLGISLSGSKDTVYRIDTSSDLTNWTPVTLLTNFSSTYPPFFTVPITTNAPARFYRAVGQ